MCTYVYTYIYMCTIYIIHMYILYMQCTDMYVCVHVEVLTSVVRTNIMYIICYVLFT